MHHLKIPGKSVQLSAAQCGVCRWESRPIRLKDLARGLEDVAWAVRFAEEHPSYDPIGLSWSQPLNKLMARFYKAMHPDYRKSFIKEICGDP